MKLFLVLVSLFLLASSRPADKKGDKQEEQEMKDQTPPYLLELYNNINKGDSDSINSLSGANVVVSLKNVAPAPQCNIFNFSLAEIHSDHERIIKSQLHLYMERHEAANTLFYVSVRELQSDEEKDPEYIMAVKPSQGSGWVVFNVYKEVASLIQSDESHAVFEVRIYQKLSDHDNEEGYLDCNESPISFVSSPSDPDKAPFLTVHSYDQAVDEIDYSSVRKSTPLKTNGQSLSRERRSLDHHTSEAQDCSPSCKVHEFEVDVANMPRSDLGTIVLPTTFNAGICGGSCELVTPFVRSSSAHTSLIHILTAYQKAKPPSSCPNAVFQRYCTPAVYRDMVVIVRSEERISRLLTLNNIIVSKCNCVEVMEFEKSSDGSGDIVYG